jgi:hypothetical protein
VLRTSADWNHASSDAEAADDRVAGARPKRQSRPRAIEG